MIFSGFQNVIVKIRKHIDIKRNLIDIAL